jgi:hypothetical protein
MKFARLLHRLAGKRFVARKTDTTSSKASGSYLRFRPQFEALEERLLLTGPPSPWSDVNVGTPAVHGSAAYESTDQTYTIVGAGTGLGGTSDQFNFCFQQLTGNGTVTAQISLPAGSGSNAEAGLMIRDGLGATAAFADLSLTPGGAQFQYRGETGAASSTLGVSTNNAWIEIVRDGNTLSAYLSPTGVSGTWTLAGTTGIVLASTVDVGMAVFSGSPSSSIAASFGGVQVEQTVPLGGNAGFANAFVDLTRDVYQMNSISWGPAPALNGNGNPTGDFRITLYDVLLPGTYAVSFTGARDTAISVLAHGSTGQQVTATISDQVYNASTNTTTANLNLPACTDGSDANFLTVGFADTGGTLQNLHIIRPGYSTVNPPLFTNEFLASYLSLGPTTLRFMDADDTNGNLVANWSERTLPTYAFPGLASLTKTVNIAVNSQVQQTTLTTSAGLPWEYMIALANAVHADLWINIPVLATDYYVQQLASLIKNGDNVGGVAYAGLAPDLNVYVEYGNEMWNYDFQQSQINLASTLLAVDGGHSNLDYDGTSSNAYMWAQRAVAQRSVQITNDFAAVFGTAAINTRIRSVLADQDGSIFTSEDQLRYVQTFYGTPGNCFYGLAQGTYFGLSAAQDDNPNLTPTQIINDLLADASSVIPEIQSFVTEAHAWGLQPLSYEGGPALGDTLAGVDNNHLAANAAAENDPAFANIVEQELDAWLASGGGLFNYYSLGEAPVELGSQFGDWWITDNINNQNEPKEIGYRAVRDGALPALSGGFSTLPGELDGRDYNGNATPLVNEGYACSYLDPSPFRDYSIRVSAPSTYQLQVNVPLAGTTQAIAISVNGQLAGTVLTPVGSGWGYTPSLTIQLEAGFNTIRLSTSSSIDSLQFLNAKGTPLAYTFPILDLATIFGITTAENTTFTTSFTVSDTNVPASSLTVTAVSSNPALVPNDAANLAIDAGNFGYGGQQNRQLVITPAVGQMGQANITVTLTGDGRSRVAVLHLIVAPPPPTALTATATSPSQVNLQWVAGNSLMACQVDQSTNASFTNLVTYNVPTGATSFTVKGLTAGTTYYFRVRTIGTTTSGNSTNSGSVFATTANAPAGLVPPTISSPASAVLAASGLSAALTVLGADAAGDSGLIYTWFLIGQPPGRCSFSANGTKAAKNIEVYFRQAGTYTFLVVIADRYGLATTSVVTVSVEQIVTSFNLSPSATTVAPGETVQVTASNFVDQFGKPMAIPPQVACSVPEGTISPWGLFTAPISDDGVVTISALANGVVETVSIIVS